YRRSCRRRRRLRLLRALRCTHRRTLRPRCAAGAQPRQGNKDPLPPDGGGAARAADRRDADGIAFAAARPARTWRKNGMTIGTEARKGGAASPRKSDPLLQTLRIKGLLLRNRVMSTSHASTLDDGGMPKERYQRYHEEKAKGGLALTMFGGSSMVSPDSSWGGGQINVSTDD